MKLKTENYKDLVIEVFFWEADNGFSANCLHLYSSNTDNGFTGNFTTYDAAVSNLKFKIDQFLLETPKTWDELSEAITASLCSSGYESYYTDTTVVKTLVTNFIKYNKGKVE